MSSRKNVLLPFTDPALTAKSMATSGNGTAINIQYLDNVGVQSKWTGASPTGTINYQVSLDYNPHNPSVATWDNIQDPPGTDVVTTPGGTPGSNYTSFNQLDAAWFRVVYTTTGGSVGSLTVTIGAKMI